MRLFWISKQALWLAVLFAGSILVSLSVQPPEALYILIPALVAVWICSYSILRVWKEDREIPILDIGVYCVIFTTLYTVVPLLNFYFGGLDFGLLSDARLQHRRPSAEELGLFFRNHIAYLASLAFAYSLFRRSNKSLPRLHVSPPGPKTLRVVVFMFLVFTFYFAALLYLFGIGFKSGYDAESNISEGPLWLQQINGKLGDILFISQAAVLGFLVLRKNDARIRIFLYLLIAWSVLSAFLQPGSRGSLMSLLLLTVLFWHRFHGVPMRFIVVFVPLAFTAFMFLGLFRSFLDLSALTLVLDEFKTIASATNEFQALLGTSFDVYKMMESGVDIPPMLALNDFMPMLPPQQLWPFQKITGADWYVVQIGQEGTGAGFMWGVISQSLIGFGLIELIVRGAVLGWFLAYVHRWYQRRYTKFLPTVFYVFLCLSSLWTFRDTTGAILWSIWWALIPFGLIFYLLGRRSEFSPIAAAGSGPHHRSSLPAAPRAAETG